jgi:hypothetical protein
LVAKSSAQGTRAIALGVVASIALVAGCGSSGSHAGARQRASAATTSAAPSTTTTTTRPPPSPSTTNGAAAAKAALDAYCGGLRGSGYADVTLFDGAMRPILVRLLKMSAYRTQDGTLAADATAVSRTITASVSAASLARVPAPIRADVRAVRIEKQAIVQHVVAGANGDASAFQFEVQAESTEGGVAPQLIRIMAFLRSSCPAADLPAPERGTVP